MHNVYLNTDIIKRYGFEVEIARIMFYCAFGYELKGFFTLFGPCIEIIST